MDFILGTVAPLVFEYSIGHIARHVSYPFNYKNKVTSLEDGVNKLKIAREDRQRWVDEHERNGKEISQDVLDWLKDVSEFVEKEEAELSLAKEKTKKKWCLGFCPNLKTRYQVSKKAEQKVEVAARFSEKNGTFPSHHIHTPPLQCIEGFSSKDFEALESRKSILNDIMKALASVDVNTIGVYGTGGVGKTTIAREVRRKAREEKLFDEVIMVTVTIDVDVMNIQKTMADFLGLKFNEESKEGRAARLCERLMKKEKKILIILDDLWKKLKLEEVGIPQPGEHNGCKLLLTSRNSNVLSNEMSSQKLFQINVLAEDEAWGLFQKISGSSFDDPVAMDVAKWCAGLPIAIVTVASSLKGKDSYEWRNALTTLKTTPPDGLTEMLAEVYWPIQLSYSKLENEQQSTFLLCCQLGYKATIRDLLKYGIGVGLFDVVKVEDAQCRVYSLVQELKRRCLLLEGNSNGQLVIHDLVRDVGRWIAYHHHGVVVVADDRNNPKDWADEEKIKTYKRIWLYNNAVKLQEELQCPDLVFLHIDGNDGDLQLPDNLFKGLDKLKVLSLTGFNFSSLPSSIGSLKSLTTLSFYHSSQLGDDVRIVGGLENLGVLSFAKSNIRHLPEEIGQLTKLKLLDLSDCHKLEVIPSNVLSKLSRLEELYMANSFDNWEMEGGNNASLTELKQLHSLSNLEIAIRDANLIPEGLFSEKLCRYRIFIGEDNTSVDSWYWVKEGEVEMAKILKLRLRANNNMPNGVLHLLKETQELSLDGVDKLLNGQISFHTLWHGPVATVGNSFQNLMELCVRRCENMKYVFSYSLTKHLRQLKNLSLSDCEEMEEVIGIEEGEQSMNNKVIVFPQLLHLELDDLQKLKRFCKGYLLNCPLLKELKIKGCPNLKTFITREHEEMRLEGTDQNATPTPPALFNDMVTFPSLVEMYLIDLDSMQSIWDNQLSSGSFGELRTLSISQCQKLLKVFPSLQRGRFQKLEELTVGYSMLVEEIFEDEEGGSNNHVASFQLRHLHIDGLPKLKNVFPYSIATQLKKLERFDILFSGVEEIVAKGEMDELTSLRFQNNKVIVFPQLLQLRLCGLPILKRFCKGYLLEFPLLKELQIIYLVECQLFISGEHEEMRWVGMDQNATPTPVPPPPTLLRKLKRFCKCPLLKELEIDQNAAPITIPPPPPPALFNDMVIFRSLVEMGIWQLDSMESIWDNQLASGSFHELRKLTISSCGKLRRVFPSAQHGRFQKLEELIVWDSKLVEEIFEDEEGGSINHAISFQLRVLDLKWLPKLKNVFPYSTTTHLPKLESISISREGSPLSSIFQNLETLKVIECGMLEALVPSPISFQCLTTLEVSKCHKLLYLMTCTTAKSLVMLTRMSITECQMLEQIVGNEENVAESGVTLTKLESLELHCLPRFLGFSVWNCAFTFPSLKDIVVRECPKMQRISPGVVMAPKLRRVRQTEGEEIWYWKDSLNATIQKLYMDQAMLQSSQPSSPKRSNLDVEAGQLVRNGNSHISDEPSSSEGFCEIKNPSVTKDLSLDESDPAPGEDELFLIALLRKQEEQTDD